MPYANGGFRWSSSSYAASCADYRIPPPSSSRKPAVANGAFWVQPKGASTPVKVYCNMCTNGGGWRLAFVKNSRHTTPITGFCASDRNLPALAISPETHSNSSTSTLGWLDLNKFEFANMWLGAYNKGKQTYASKVIARSSLRINFGQNGYYLYNSPNKYYWCGGDKNYTDAGRGQVSRPSGAPADCKGHGSLGSGWDFSESTGTNQGLTLCGGDASRWMHTTYRGTPVNFGTTGGAQAIWVRAAQNVVTDNGGYKYPDGSYAKDCLGYRIGNASFQPITTSGVFWIKPTSAAAFKVHCDMTTRGGGWTLILKADGRRNTFRYASAYWANTATLNPNDTALDLKEAKFASYNTVSMAQILIGMRDPISMSTKVRWNTVNKAGANFRAVMSTNRYAAFDRGMGRTAWKALMASGSLQRNCNREGFNLTPRQVRLGIQSNQENDCNSPDSFVGIGHATAPYTGNFATAAHLPDNGGKNTSAFAYVWVRGKVPLVLSQNGWRWLDGTIAKSCYGYKNPATNSGLTAAITDGIYWIKPTSAAAFRVRCNMTTDGGGWTLLGTFSNTDGKVNWGRFLGNTVWKNSTLFGSVDTSLTHDHKSAAWTQLKVTDLMLTDQSKNYVSFHYALGNVTMQANMSSYTTCQTRPLISPGDPRVRSSAAHYKSAAMLTFYAGDPNSGNRCSFNNSHNDSTTMAIGGHGCGTIGAGQVGTNYNRTTGIDWHANLDNTTACVACDSCRAWNGYSVATSRNHSNNAGVHDNSKIGYLWGRLGVTTNFGTTAANPGSSCLHIKQVTGTTKSGAYYIRPSSYTGTPYQVYCDMTTNGGGWTLVLKADGRRTTFTYNAAYWRNTTLLNPTSTAMNTTEAKFASYHTLSFKAVMLTLRTPSPSGTARSVVISKTATSMYDLLRTNAYSRFDRNLGRNAWKGLIGPTGSLQRNCNREGFNNYHGYAHVRIGIISNQENDCNSPDSRIGVGGGGTACGQNGGNSVGNTAICTPDNGNRDTRSFGYVFVR